MRHPFNLAFSRRTRFAALEALHAEAPGLRPAGLIFHMSRCGSTLIAQMLAQLSATIVLSEPQPLDALIRLRRRGVDDATLAGWLRGMAGALAQPRNGEQRLFFKFHAWHVLELPLIRRAFPGVPWIFVFREPRAVLRSHERMPGPEVTAGMIDFPGAGVAADTFDPEPPAEYAARVLAAFCEAALAQHASGPCAFVAYDDLPEAFFSELLPFFGVAATSEECERMRAASRRDSKAPSIVSAPRGDGHVAWQGLEEAAAHWLDAPHAALRGAAAQSR
jgi:hypothetical protein